jgi:hypothetical protein
MFPLLGALTPIISKLLSFIPDPQQRAELAVQLQTLDNQIAIAQAGTNTEEAKSASMFVAGWRPFIGWCCGVCFVYGVVLQPMFHGILKTSFGVDVPPIDTNAVYMVLGGMLGLGGMRSYEKTKGIQDTVISFMGKKK